MNDISCQNEFKTFNFSLGLGANYIAKFDNSILYPTGMNEVNSRIRPLFELNGKVCINKSKVNHYFIDVSLNTYGNSVSEITSMSNDVKSYKNQFISTNITFGFRRRTVVKNKILFFNLGLTYNKHFALFPHVTLLNGTKLYPKNFGYTSTSDYGQREEVINSKLYFGPNSFGTTIGVDYPVSKLTLGLYYYQRLYFTGFNREIARVMLRVGF
jgi:hypothetical protein